MQQRTYTKARFLTLLFAIVTITAQATVTTSTILSENFTGFTATSYSDTKASQTVTSGTWSYENVIMTPTGASNGTGSTGYAQLKASSGKLYLPAVDNPTSISVTSRTSSGSLTLQQKVNGTWTTIQTWSLTDTGVTYSYTFTNAGEAIELCFVAGSKATYIHDVTIEGNSSSGGGTNTTLAYYANADGTKGAALKTALCGIIYNRTEKSYDYLWTAFQTTDVRSDGKIWDMYSDKTNYVPGGSAQGANYSAEGDSYNREHSFPKSWFGGEVMPMYTDLHHMYPTDGFVNNKRANYPFGTTNGNSYKSHNSFSKLGTCTYQGYTGTVFEPADEYKGDFARTYFYMITCYEEKLKDWYDGNADGVRATIDGSKYPGFTEWQLEMLMKWAKNDPVSEKETNRNNAVYSIQNNRNPFIDYPGLEEYIWGTLTTTAFSYDNYVNPYTTPVLAVDPYTTNVGSGATSGTLNVIATNFNLTDVTSYQIEFDNGSAPDWLTLTVNENTYSTISYSVQANDGVARTATFRLHFTYDNNDISSETITISQAAYVDSNTSGTENNPYTVAQARDAIDAGTGTQGVYATGIVSSIVTAYNSQYGNISYDISSDGLTTSDQLRVYRGKSYNGNNFTSANDIQVGDRVVVYGNLILYNNNNNNIYEFEANNRLVSLVRKQNVTMSFDPTEATATVGEDFTEPTLTTAPANLSVTYSSTNTNVATVDSSTGEVTLLAAGETTITATFAGDDSYNGNEASYTLTVNAASVTPAIGNQYVRISSLDQLKDGSVVIIAARYNSTATTSYYAMPNTLSSGKATGVSFTSSTSNGNECLPESLLTVNNENVEDNYYWVVNVTTSNNATTYTFTNANGNKIGYNSSTNFKLDGDKTNWKISKQTSATTGPMVTEYSGFVISNATTTNRDFAFNGSAFGAYSTGNNNMSSSNYNFYLDFFVQSATVTLSPNCYDGNGDDRRYYGTYSNSSAFYVPADLTVSTVSVSDGKLTVTNYSTDDVVKANTGVMISSATFGNHAIVLASKAGTEKDGNMLKPSGNTGITSANMNVANTKFYRLTMHNGTDIGFWWGAENGAAFAVAANKAYLAVPNGTNLANMQSFWFDENETNDIDAFDKSTNDTFTIYDLQGRRLDQRLIVNGQLPRGIYIVNGKKVVIK